MSVLLSAVARKYPLVLPLRYLPDFTILYASYLSCVTQGTSISGKSRQALYWAVRLLVEFHTRMQLLPVAVWLHRLAA
jgi:hypothetical protein